MSGAIRDVERLNQRQIETAKRRNERELKAMNDAHQDYKADVKKTHEAEIVDIQNVNHAHLDKEAEKKEKVLEEMRSHLQKTSEMTDKELKTLKSQSETQKVAIERKNSEDRQRITSENELYLEEMNDRFNSQSRRISHDGKNRIEDMKSQKQQEYLDVEGYHQKKIHDQTNEFTTRFNRDELKNKTLKDQQDNQFKKERLTTNQKQQVELSKMTQTHTDHIEKRDGVYRKGLKEQDQFFEDKYGKQLETHSSTFKTLEDKNNKVIEDLKTSLSSEIKKVADRNDDPFFKFETLNPKLTIQDKHVEVSVEIPEHSKQDIQLTINGKEAIVTFNRRYSDANKKEDGSINKINKVETFTSRLATGHFLNAKSVKTNYENGVMSYQIQKA